MASAGAIFVIFAALAAVFPATTIGKEFIVGDSTGWTNSGFNYQVWAQGKDFRVGDKLLFNYPVGRHNVFKVNGTQFQNCTIPPPNEALTSGNDTIVLATPGRKWYICGVGQHCAAGGQKLAINVQPLDAAPTPSPAKGWTYPSHNQNRYFDAAPGPSPVKGWNYPSHNKNRYFINRFGW